MAMSKDKLAGILAKAPRKSEELEDEESTDIMLDDTEDEEVDLRVDLAADVADALRSKDDTALADALEAFLDHCYASREE